MRKRKTNKIDAQSFLNELRKTGVDDVTILMALDTYKSGVNSTRKDNLSKV